MGKIMVDDMIVNILSKAEKHTALRSDILHKAVCFCEFFLVHFLLVFLDLLEY